MRKEVLLAIIAGGALGLAIAFGVWRLNTNLKPKVEDTAIPSQIPETPTVTPTPLPNPSEFKVILTKPNNKSVLTDTPVVPL